MKPSILAAALAPLLLIACARVDRMGFPFHGAIGEGLGRGDAARQYAADVRACDHGPGAEWCRIAADNGNLARQFPLDQKPVPAGTTYVYDASQCVGKIEHGMCRGSSLPRLSYTPVCHGETIDGLCAGPVF